MHLRLHGAVLALALLLAGCTSDEATCRGDSTICSGTCVRLASDVQNCGACGNACDPGFVCSAGTCALSCQVGRVDCAGSCVDPLMDRDHCGVDAACGGGDVCADGEVCAAGTCALSCQAGLVDCGGTCVDPLRDRNHCGVDAACAGGAVCGGGELCTAGACVLSCPDGQVACAGACMDPAEAAVACGPPPTSEYRYLLTANTDDQTVSVVALPERAVVATIPVSLAQPREITVTADGMLAFVSCRGDRTEVSPGGIAILDLAGLSEIGTVAGLSGFDPAKTLVDGSTLYVAWAGGITAANGGGSGISIVDLSATPPAETGVISMPDGAGILSLALDPLATRMYAGSAGQEVHVIEFTAAPPVYDFSVFTGGAVVHALEPVGDLIYLAEESVPGGGIEAIDTTTDLLVAGLPAGIDGRIQATVTTAGVAWAANEVGGIGRIDLARDYGAYQWFQADDGGLQVTLPFAFPFAGSSYATATVSSNGFVTFDPAQAATFDVEVGELTAIAPFTEDLDSLDGRMFDVSYNLSADGAKAVFQWCTATNDLDADPAAAMMFEVVLFDDGRARLDYAFAGPTARTEDGFHAYGVGAGEPGAPATVFDMRAAFGSPFHFQRRSFLFDPGLGTVAEVPFAWEGTGIEWHPASGAPDGLALVDGGLVAPLSVDPWSGGAVSYLGFYDAATLAEEIVLVGKGPRAVAPVP